VTYFAMARDRKRKRMTKPVLTDTAMVTACRAGNDKMVRHQLSLHVPELGKDQTFALASRKPIEEYAEAKSLGYQTRPVLIGSVTFLKLAKSTDAGFDPLSLAGRLLPVYVEVLRELAPTSGMGELDEPCSCSISIRRPATHCADLRRHSRRRCLS